MIAAALALVLHYTTPVGAACGGGCVSCGPSMYPVAEVALIAAGDTAARKAAGPPGLPDSIAYAWDGTAVAVYVVTRALGGPWSCPSNTVLLGPVTVPPAPSGGAWAYYDVAGRRVRLGGTPGVYFGRYYVAGRAVERKAVVVW